MVKIGLPKGVVKSKSLELIEELLGIKADKNRLNFSKDDVNIYLLKHRDIPKLIERGKIDVGITSLEWIEETESYVEILQELDWCDTRISLISSKENSVLDSDRTIHCITEFPNISKKFFEANKKTNVKIELISGSSEALVPSLYNCCVDCVETGSTLKVHNLYEEHIILKSKVVLVTRINNSNSMDIIERITKIIRNS